MAWGFLVKPLLGVVGDVVKGVVDTRKAKSQQKIVAIQAETSLMEKKIRGELDWDIQAQKNSSSSWKDEYLTIVFSIPLILCFYPPTVEYVIMGFEALSKCPEWYFYTLGIIVSASFGIKGATKIFNKRK
jgi:hypothetical protein|tara:strand:- start:4944 stop:5333 length:390 start_codon:yes stop_codon:yes gene_type:complete